MKMRSRAVDEYVDIISEMYAKYLQYLYYIYIRTDTTGWDYNKGPNPDWVKYENTCRAIEAIGGTWERRYKGVSEEDFNDISCYSHIVILPSYEQSLNLDLDSWNI